MEQNDETSQVPTANEETINGNNDDPERSPESSREEVHATGLHAIPPVESSSSTSHRQSPHQSAVRTKSNDEGLVGSSRRRQRRVKSGGGENDVAGTRSNDDRDSIDNGVDPTDRLVPMIGAVAVSNTTNEVSATQGNTGGREAYEGAVAHIGTASATASPTNEQRPSSPYFSSPVLLEATVVQEIVATQVFSLQHVDIDVFDDSHSMMYPGDGAATGREPTTRIAQDGEIDPTDRKKKGSKPLYPRYQVCLVVVGVVVFFIGLVNIVFLVFVDVTPQGYVDSECLYMQQQTLSHLTQLKGMGIIQMTLSYCAGIALLYKVLDIVQNAYCAKHSNSDEDEQESRPPYYECDFWPDLIILVLDTLWLGCTITSVVTMAAEGIVNPASVLEGACGDDQALDDMGNLHSFSVANSASLAFLIFLTIGRGRSLVKSDSCEHIAIFWVQSWFWFKIALDVVLIVLANVGYFSNLNPVVRQVQDYVNSR